MSSGNYSMLGFDDHHIPTVAANVTTDQAKLIAEAKGLTGILLAPTLRGGEGSGKTHYEGVACEGKS